MMAENRMEQVAALFGKKLGEEFFVESSEILGVEKCKAKFTEDGFLMFRRILWLEDSWVFCKLLEGTAVIVDD